jgi:hypothetical protein
MKRNTLQLYRKITHVTFTILLENYNHKNYFHETLIFYINKFDTGNWTIMNYACANGTIPLFDLWIANFMVTCHLENFHM